MISQKLSKRKFSQKQHSKMKVNYLLIIVTLLLVGQRALAQQSLSFDEALSKVKKQNLALKGAAQNERYYEMKRRASFGHHLPRISVLGNWTMFNEDIHADFTEAKETAANTMNGMVSQMPPQTAQLIGPVIQQLAPAIGQMVPDKYVLQEQNLGLLTANVVWPLFTGGKIHASSQKAKLDKSVAVSTTKHTEHTLTTELVERYYGLRLAEKAVEVRKAVLEAMEQHLSDAKKMEQNGILSEAERLHAEVAKADAFRELQLAESKAETIRQALNNTLGDSLSVKPNSPLFLVKEVEPLSYFQGAAIGSNPQLDIISSKKEIAHLGTNVARADYMPTVAAMGSWIMLSNVEETTLIPDWFVGVTLSWTIFDGTSRTHNYIAAKELEKRVATIHEKAKSDIGILITKHYNELQSHIQQLEAMEVSYRFAEEYVRVRKKAFSEGFASSTDVVDAELMLSRVKIGRLSIMYQYDLCLAQLLQASGLSERFETYRQMPNAEPEEFKGR